MDESVDEALAVLEGLEDPGSKAIGFIDASNKLGARNRARALEVLDRALLNARAAREPDGIRLVLMGQVAERFLDLGQAERGRAILREGEALAKQLPKAGFAGYARGAFAEELVQIDLEAALALTKDLADAREFDRHHGNIAHELGGRDPAQAERVLAMVKDQFQRDLYTVRVVYRMAPLDLARARRLAESIGDDCLKGYRPGNDGPQPRRGRQGLGARGARECLRIARAFVPGSAGEIKQHVRSHVRRGRLCCRSPSESTPGSSMSASGAASRCGSRSHGRPTPAAGPRTGRRAAGDDAGPVRPGHRPLARRAARPGTRAGSSLFLEPGRAARGGRRDRPEMGRRAGRSDAGRSRLKIQKSQEFRQACRRHRAGPGGRPAVQEVSSSFLLLWVPDTRGF